MRFAEPALACALLIPPAVSPVRRAYAQAVAAAADGAAAIPGMAQAGAALGPPNGLAIGIQAQARALALSPGLNISAAASVVPVRPVSIRAGDFSIPAARVDAAWTDGAFQGASGAGIHYRSRPGKGPALLLIHGRSIGGEGFARWMRAFPGRAMMILDRRGYGASETGSPALEALGELNGGDIAKAVAIAAAMGGGKTAVVTISLGAMLLPATLSADKVAWIALLNPGVFGMLRHMDLQAASASWALINGYTAGRFWLPAAREAWIRMTGDVLIDDLQRRLREQSGTDGGGLAAALADELERERPDLAFKETLLRETVWALTAPGPLSIDARIPVFLGTSESDELIPRGAYAELQGRLERRGPAVRLAHWPGGHLEPLLNPAAVLPQLEDFDREPPAIRR